jgi:PBP1b-binding outer membrane lipoprotein LpoB
MRKLIVLVSLVVFVSCSTTKYAAHFQRYERNISYTPENISHPLAPVVAPEMLTSSISPPPMLSIEAQKKPEAVKRSLTSFTKQERKQLKKEIRKLINNKTVTEAKVITTSGGMDQDLKLAAVFGVVGLVGLIIGTTFFNVIGAIALIIGTVFLVKWILRQ